MEHPKEEGEKAAVADRRTQVPLRTTEQTILPMPDAYFNLPLIIAAPLLVGAICLYSLVGLEFVRRLVFPRLRITSEESDFTGAMVQAIMVFYGLAVALIAVSVWETHSSVSDTVSLEASRVAGLYRDAGGYPEPLRSDVRGELEGYIDHVITEAWPLQRKGILPDGGVAWMDRLQASLTGFEPQTEGQKILHGEALRAFNLMMEARRLRLDAVTTKLSGVLWFVIGAGGLVSLASTFFFKVEDVRYHRVQVVLLAAFVGMVINLIAALDRPFRGDLGIDAGPYRLVQDQLMKQ